MAALVSGGLVFLIDLWKGVKNIPFYAIDGFKSQNLNILAITVLFFVSTVLSLSIIFLFKNRKLQFVLGRVNILINLILLGLIAYQSLNLSGETLVSEKGIGSGIPIIVILLLVMANKAIKRDEDLVKSVDRLR